MKFKILILVLIVTVLFTGCAKDGETGPVGPSGSNGVANISTTLDTIFPGEWSNGGSQHWTDINIAAITNPSKDVVLVYVKFDGDPNWYALPSKDLLISGDYFEYHFSVNRVDLWYTSTPAIPAENFYCRIIVIPPTSKISSVDYIKYESVKAAYKLKD
jgi:hypothetical protein